MLSLGLLRKLKNVRNLQLILELLTINLNPYFKVLEWSTIFFFLGI